MVSTLEARSHNKIVTKEDILRLIIQKYIPILFLHPHLKRETVTGYVGDRGGGKSGSSAVQSIVNFLIAGKPVWSNMSIKCDMMVDDETARLNGLNSGGSVHYESLPLEKDALLNLDDTYRDGCLVIEEINVQYSNVRRFMTNTNIDFNEACQQLRKFRTSLIYNVIDEMFIDPQLRALTDIMIKTYDTAFDQEALDAKKDTGIDFCWRIYPLTGYLCGEQGKYGFTHKPLPPAKFNFTPWRGVYNTNKHQTKGVYSISTKDKKKLLSVISAESTPEMDASMRETKWVADKVKLLTKQGIKFMDKTELSQTFGKMMDKEFRDVLAYYGVHFNRFKQLYEFPENFQLERERVEVG